MDCTRRVFLTTASGVALGARMEASSVQGANNRVRVAIIGTGGRARGPGAPATGPPHHYVFELFALDAAIDVAPIGASPAETRAAVLAAMAGKVRGKAAMVGMYKR